MPDLKEYIDLLERRNQSEKEHVRHVFEQRMPQIMDITHKAQMVLDHPGWQMYADKIESRIKEIQGKRDATAERMVTGNEMGHDLELLKINLNAMDAEIAGLRYAASLIPQALEIGRDIARSPLAGSTTKGS